MKKSQAKSVELPDASGLHILVVHSRFNDEIVSGLAKEALRYLGSVGAQAEVATAPGAFELPLIAKAAALTGRYDAVIALGAVIKGETDHYEHIARETARGLQDASLQTGVPVAFGVLTVTRMKHATARSKPGAANKGREAASAAVETALLLRRIKAGPPDATPETV